METKKELTKELTKEQIDLMKKDQLESDNLMKSLAINKATSNGKYKYPLDLQQLDSKDAKKKHYRNKVIQPILRALLSIAEPTKENLNSFNTAIKLYFNSYNNISQFTDVTEIYKIQNVIKKEQYQKVLNKYKAIK